MSQIVTLQDLLNQVDDFNQNYSVTTIDPGNKIRAINRAIEFVQQRLGLPSDRKIMTFKFYEDTLAYNIDDGYSDMVGLFYNTTGGSVTGDYNTPSRTWFPFEDTEILRSTGQYKSQNRFAFTTQNGSNQLLCDGNNIRSSTLIQPFDSLTGISYTAGIVSPSIDTNIYKQGGGSYLFGITTGEALSQIYFTGNWDIRQPLNNGGAYRLWVFFPTGVTTSLLSSIEIRLQSSTGNYYKIQTTTDYLGAAWASNDWSKLSFDLANATTTGTPNAAAITTILVGFTHGGSFVPISNMRIDDLYIVQPDLLDFVYYSAFKGTDTTGVTKKIWLDTASDILSFGPFAPDLILPISIKAALILWPQLRADPSFYAVYQTDFKDTILLYGKRYPRKRNPVAASTRLARG